MMLEVHARTIERLKRNRDIRIAVMLNYNGVNSGPGSYGGPERWLWEDGTAVRKEQLAKRVQV